jgi:predicted carbohydrate-binding protein with CBM5 and CBM33 domain
MTPVTVEDQSLPPPPPIPQSQETLPQTQPSVTEQTTQSNTQQSAREQLRQQQKYKFSKKSHVRLQVASQTLAASKDSAEYSLDSVEFDRIQQLSGKGF